MTGCTDSKRWAITPGADATEEEVTNYLAHVEVCPFHMAVEQREEALVRGVTGLARRDLIAQGSGPWAHAARGTVGRRSRRQERRKASGMTLLIRVNGVERACADLTSRCEVGLEVQAGSLVAVWQRGWDDGSAEDYLTSWLVPAGGEPMGTKQVSETALVGGGKITFTAEAGPDTRTRRLIVTYAAAVQSRLSAHALADSARALSRGLVSRSAATLCALLAAVLLALVVFFLRAGEPVPVAKQEPSPTDAAHTPPSPEPTSIVEGTGAQHRHETLPRSAPSFNGTPAPTRTPRATRGLRRTDEQMTVTTVRRVYVNMGEGNYDRQLCEALIERLQAGNRFTVVTTERQADAVLLREQSRGAGTSVQLLTRTGRTLWFTTQPTVDGGVENVDALAARIVAALTTAADEPRPSVNSPRQ